MSGIAVAENYPFGCPTDSCA